jgi:hypothetical protein
MKFVRLVSLAWLAMLAIGSAAADPENPNDRLEAIAQSDHTIWNRVTVSADGRIFVNFPPLSSRPLQPIGAKFIRSFLWACLYI